MITCVFAGHRQIFKANISEKVKEALEKLIENESRIVFLNGNMGRFDDVCAGAVHTLKKKYPEKEIRNCLVIAYYSNPVSYTHPRATCFLSRFLQPLMSIESRIFSKTVAFVKRLYP